MGKNCPQSRRPTPPRRNAGLQLGLCGFSHGNAELQLGLFGFSHGSAELQLGLFGFSLRCTEPSWSSALRGNRTQKSRPLAKGGFELKTFRRA